MNFRGDTCADHTMIYIDFFQVVLAQCRHLLLVDHIQKIVFKKIEYS